CADFAKLRVTHLNRGLSRESLLIAVQPISFVSRSTSVWIRPSARWTPAWLSFGTVISAPATPPRRRSPQEEPRAAPRVCCRHSSAAARDYRPGCHRPPARFPPPPKGTGDPYRD